MVSFIMSIGIILREYRSWEITETSKALASESAGKLNQYLNHI